MTRAILSCTGLDKSLGSLAREVAIRGADTLQCEIICPVLLHSAPARYEKTLAGSELIVIDGCPTRCATKLANQIGAKVDRKVLLTDAVKVSGLTLEPSLALGPHGIELAQHIVDDLVRELTAPREADSAFPSLVAPDDYLTVTQDKYQFRIPTHDYAFTENDTWVRIVGEQAFVGVSDYIQQKLTDITYFVPPASGEAVEQFGEIGTIESAKAVLEIIAPVSGSVVAVNTSLIDHPELINEDPYGAGWIALLTLTDYAVDQELLLDGAAYAAVVQKKAAEEAG